MISFGTLHSTFVADTEVSHIKLRVRFQNLFLTAHNSLILGRAVVVLSRNIEVVGDKLKIILTKILIDNNWGGFPGP